jgi:hypothetical protein
LLEVTIVPDDDFHQEKHPEFMEEGVEVPFEKISPETLKNLISEFVTREWEEVGDSTATLDDKVNQVMLQLKTKKAKVVFDLRSETCNIVVVKGR